jgi:hypothetical protein
MTLPTYRYTHDTHYTRLRPSQIDHVQFMTPFPYNSTHHPSTLVYIIHSCIYGHIYFFVHDFHFISPPHHHAPYQRFVTHCISYTFIGSVDLNLDSALGLSFFHSRSAETYNNEQYYRNDEVSILYLFHRQAIWIQSHQAHPTSNNDKAAWQVANWNRCGGRSWRRPITTTVSNERDPGIYKAVRIDCLPRRVYWIGYYLEEHHGRGIHHRPAAVRFRYHHQPGILGRTSWSRCKSHRTIRPDLQITEKCLCVRKGVEPDVEAESVDNDGR